MISGTTPSTIAAVVIRIGRRRIFAGLLDRLAAADALCVAQIVGELDHQDAVLGDQADQRDQADLGVDVDGRKAEIEEAIAPNIDSGTDTMMTNGSRKLSNCAASTR